MHTVIVEKECGCFRRSDLENNIQISAKDDALIKAMEMKNHMNEEFCGKHDFEVIESANNFIISFAAQPQGGGCGSSCGCGH